ncbi:MAG: LTA synthase family protein [Lachnospiraceae bacterium]|nr:LTA synthase family protein [Lachnospiraceae bacterium]
MSNKKTSKKKTKTGVIADLILCGCLSIIIEAILEICDWRSVDLAWVFFQDRTWVFFYNCLIIFITFLPVFLVGKKLFVYILSSALWLGIGITNGTMLGYRNTPFTAVDISLVKSTLPVVSNYMSMPQLVGLIVLLILVVAALVCLFLYCPKSQEKKTFPRRIGCVIFILLVFAGATRYGLDKELLEDRFSNIRLAYRAYGTPYCFAITLFDNGIDRPLDYSSSRVEKLVDSVNEKYEKKKKAKEQTPNIIFLQLESFFDVTRVKGMEFSEDPIPFYRSMMEKYSSGFVSTPTYGAGTVNTEFEIITGMNKNYFGAGEYPYKSILQDHTCESMCFVLKDKGYTSHAIHNNNASFYDRDYVYANLGFDDFTTLEFMNIMEVTPNGWAKDTVLTKYIQDALDSTDNQDLIYTVSVQGHGEYPTEPLDTNTIEVTGGETEEINNQFAYYAQQIKEMDQFLEELIESLNEREEDTVLVVYGDHLPNLEVETDDLKSGSKFETDYFIWDNIGLDKEDENVEAYQLYSKVFEQLGIGSGLINKYHQTYKGTKNYSKNLKLLEYDLLYGNDFAYGVPEAFEKTDMTFGLKHAKITSINTDEENNEILFSGENFTPYTRILVNGTTLETDYRNRILIEWSGGSLKEGDEITIIQKSKTNQHPILWQSPTYIYHEGVTPYLEEKVEEEE